MHFANFELLLAAHINIARGQTHFSDKSNTENFAHPMAATLQKNYFRYAYGANDVRHTILAVHHFECILFNVNLKIQKSIFQQQIPISLCTKSWYFFFYRKNIARKIK